MVHTAHMFNQIMKQENIKILQSSVSFLQGAAYLKIVGEGVCASHILLIFGQIIPIAANLNSKINNFLTRYHGKFVLNIPYSIISVSSTRPRDWKRLC